MLIHVTPNDPVPIYQQIVNQVKYMISSGHLRPNDELPPIRTLSETLLVNPNTVARAYQDLERDGFVTCRRGIGTRVCAVGSPLSDTERMRVLRDRAKALLTEARQMNLHPDDVFRLVAECAEEMNFGSEVQRP